MKPSITKYLATIGARGGAKGGLARGKRKARTPEQYAHAHEIKAIASGAKTLAALEDIGRERGYAAGWASAVMKARQKRREKAKKREGK